MLFAGNVNIFSLLYKQLKTDRKSFIFAEPGCRGEEGRGGQGRRGQGEQGRGEQRTEGEEVQIPYLHNTTTLIHVLYNFQLSTCILKLDKAQGSD